jgi:aryl-alcohol dehydrogenase-like predicted oxidoreductase
MISKGMALAPWAVLAGGKFRTDEEEERRRKTGENGRTVFGLQWERTEEEKRISRALEKVASEVGTKHITSGLFTILPTKYLSIILISGTQLLSHI